MLSGKGKIAAVLGWPINHSRSPVLHGYWLERYGIDGVTVPLAVREGDLADALKMLPRLGFVGANITIPHKEAAWMLVQHRDDAAERIGAVNTITIKDDGSLYGQNTDAYGFIANLQSALPHWSLNGRRVLMIGAGGAARAILFGLLSEGVVHIDLVNRTQARGEALVSAFESFASDKVNVVPWTERHQRLSKADLVVNTTSLGMSGQPDLQLDLEKLPASSVVADIVYAPRQTPLLQMAQARGNQTVEGIGMLIHQARPGFKAWFGRDPEVTQELEDFLIAQLDADQS